MGEKRKREEEIGEGEEIKNSKDPKQAKKDGQSAPAPAEVDLVAFALARNWPALEKAVEEGGVTTQQLARPIEMPNLLTRGQNLAWYLANYSQENLLNKLVQKRLFTTEILINAPDQGYDIGRSVFLIIVHQKRWGMVEQLIDQGYITTELLLIRLKEDGSFDQRSSVLGQLIRDEKWNLIIKLVPYINAQLLMEEEKSSTSFLSHLLRGSYVRNPEILDVFRLLLNASLDPLAHVPQAIFAAYGANLMTGFLLKGDLVTFEQLKKLGAPLPSPKNKEVIEFMADLAAKKEVESFCKLEAIYREDNQTLIPAKTDYHPLAQRIYWHWQALQEIQTAAEGVGYAYGDLADNSRVGKQQLPTPLKQLIAFYSSGDQQGVQYLFKDKDCLAFLAKKEEGAAPRATYEQHWSFFAAHQKKGEDNCKAAAAVKKEAENQAIKQEAEIALVKTESVYPSS